MRRREFIAGLGSSTIAWPLAARAQQSGRVRRIMRRIGVLTNLPANDAQMQTRNGAFLEALQQLGWAPGRNVEIEYRWGGEVADRNREYAAELVALAPDVIVSAGGSPGLAALQRATRTVPIVFANYRSGRPGLRRGIGAAGRQHHRVHDIRVRPQCEMAGTAQEDRAWHVAGGGRSGRRHRHRKRGVGSNPVGGAIIRG
jgi:hypothetical protein